MMGAVLTKLYSEPDFNIKEILRCAGCNDYTDTAMLSLAEECIGYVKGKLAYKACYIIGNVLIDADVCKFDYFSVKSKDLAKNLDGCANAVIFAATVGVEMDRIISKFKSASPSKAVMLQAIGAERVESLCDMLVKDLSKEIDMPLKPRFSPGYGDLSIDIQKDIFEVLKCHKHIGAALCDSMFMLPTKTVTAFIGY